MGSIALASRQETSVPELAEYICELANELAQMAKAATLEAERLITQDSQFEPSRPALN